MDSQKGANWAQIIGTVIGAALLGYAVWDHWPTANQSSIGVGWGGIMKGYVPSAVIALILFASSALQLTLWRRRRTAITYRQEADRQIGGWKENANNLMELVVIDRDNAHSQAEKLTTDLIDERQAVREADKRASEARNESQAHHRLFEDRERQLGDLLWLKKRMEEQAKDLSAQIIIKKVKPLTLNLASSPRCIVLALTIRNESVFDVTIHPEKVVGSLFFKNKARHDPARASQLDHSPIQDLRPRHEGILLIEQPLLMSEAETISDALNDPNARFWLGNLKIPISVENIPQQVTPQNLRIVDNKEHVYLNDFGALTFNGEVITPEELFHDIDALRPSERARVYQAASDAYGESLHRLHEAEEKRKEDDPESPD